MQHRLLIAGGGKMGSAILSGLLQSEFLSVDECAILERVEATRDALEARFPGVTVVSQPISAESVLLAVKPGDMQAVCSALAVERVERVLSIAAGVTTAQIESWFSPGMAVVRAMPNMPALVGAAASAVCGGRSCTEEDLDWARAVLSSIGIVVTVPERLIDVVTGVSGSGPAYIFLIAEALVEAGVLGGLDRKTSSALVAQTILGAGRLLETGEAAESLRHAVTSPGGTTAEALRVLEERSVRAAFIDAAIASTARSRELGS